MKLLTMKMDDWPELLEAVSGNRPVGRCRTGDVGCNLGIVEGKMLVFIGNMGIFDGKMGKFMRRFDVLSGKMDVLNGRIGKMTGRIDVFSDRMAVLFGRMDLNTVGLIVFRKKV